MYNKNNNIYIVFLRRSNLHMSSKIVKKNGNIYALLVFGNKTIIMCH